MNRTFSPLDEYIHMRDGVSAWSGGDRVLFVVAHILNWRTALDTHAQHCATHSCEWIASWPPPEGANVRALVTDSADDCRMRFYHHSSFLHMRGLALLQQKMGDDGWYDWYDWYVFVDDNTRVVGGNWTHMSTPLQLSPRAIPMYAGDFADQGHSEFACGGGGFLLSNAAFRRVNFSQCIESCSRHAHPQSVGLDHIMQRCMVRHNIQPKKQLSCGTCGNRWSPKFTAKRVRSGECSFMHMQRSHSPSRYAALVKSSSPHRALLVHRHAEL